MSIEVMVINDDAIVIKGLRSANESRNVACEYNSQKRAEAETWFKERDFFNKALEEIISDINRKSEYGYTEATASGWGTRSSVLRGWWDKYDIEVINEIFKSMIYPILRQQGYTINHSYGSFATKEKYIDVKITW
jgi:hypothetical protein